jgi:predicted PurR-regulated permease PerM
MAYLDTNRQRAAFLLLLLGAALVFALAPFATGLLGIPVLYVIFLPIHDWLAPRIGPRTSAALVVTIALLLIVVPGAAFAGLIVTQAQEIASGVAQSPIFGRLAHLRIGRLAVGPHLAELGTSVVAWLGSSAFGFIGTATRLALNLTIALFGLYYLLLRAGQTWSAVSPYIPFSTETKTKLRVRFRSVTTSTVIGTGVTSVLQGALLALGFWVTGLPNVLFWGVVTVVLAILPVVGSGLVLAPAVVVLALDHRYLAAIGLAVWGIVAVGNVDYVIRPMVFRRWAQIHPLTTLVGAVAGVPYFGILGLLIGPLAVSYFFELSGLYRDEYMQERASIERTAELEQGKLKEHSERLILDPKMEIIPGRPAV